MLWLDCSHLTRFSSQITALDLWLFSSTTNEVPSRTIMENWINFLQVNEWKIASCVVKNDKKRRAIRKRQIYLESKVFIICVVKSTKTWLAGNGNRKRSFEVWGNFEHASSSQKVSLEPKKSACFSLVV